LDKLEGISFLRELCSHTVKLIKKLTKESKTHNFLAYFVEILVENEVFLSNLLRDLLGKYQISYDKLNSRSIEFYRRAYKLSELPIISNKLETIYFMGNTFVENKKTEEHFYVRFPYTKTYY